MAKKFSVLVAAFTLFVSVTSVQAGFWLGTEMFLSDVGGSYGWLHPQAAYNSQVGYFLIAFESYSGATSQVSVDKVVTPGVSEESVGGLTWEDNDSINPALAYNATENVFMAVWMYDTPGDGSAYEIWGRNVHWNENSVVTSAKFKIFSWANRSLYSPRIAWNSLHNEYLVVWSALNTLTSQVNDVSAARVSPLGVVQAPSPITISEDRNPHHVDVTYNLAADEYLVVWRRMWTGTDGDIMGARLRGSDGVMIAPGIFTIDDNDHDQLHPAVTTNQQGRYFVVWQQLYTASPLDHDIYGIELDVTGAPIGSAFPIATTSYDETVPDVAAKPGAVGDYTVVWQRGADGEAAVWATRLAGDEPYFEVVGQSGWSKEVPVIAHGAPGYLIAYEHTAPAVPTQIYARFFWPNAAFLPITRRP